ncbi:TcmI family type II polyketide cyclase [Spirillospora sp. CA-294931]|uniref:TcmI family type II polyketide cyclase n=1 Tax=Spirillospora sp. CA-294931 TaxID=3240042 RepID=UPI003D905AE5
MTERTLIVARMRPGSAAEVAELFAASDGAELPRALGVTRRDLYLYHDLYFHYVEFDGSASDAMAGAGEREDFQRLCRDLDPHITPYDPKTWASPADARAKPFYHWTGEAR